MPTAPPPTKPPAPPPPPAPPKGEAEAKPLKFQKSEPKFEPPRIILNGVEGWGKCLGKGTPVLMFDGTVTPVENVQEGDLLMGPDSEPRRVRGVCTGHGPLYRVMPTKGDPYVINDKHVLSLKMSRRHGCDFHEVLNIPVQDYLQQSDAFKRDALGWRVGVEWPEANLPIPPYLFGCWLGDGTSTSPDITTAEPEILNSMEAYADSVGLMVKKRAECGKAATFAVTGGNRGGRQPNALRSALRQLEVLGNKHIPYEYLTASREQRLELLAGLLDTDGHLYQNCFDVTLHRRVLADGLVFVARSLGLAAYVAACEKSCTNAPRPHRDTYWRTKISGHTNMIPNRVPNKKATMRGQRKHVLVTGLSVEAIGEGSFFGFDLDGDHLFLLGDFTVTHNTSTGAFAPRPAILMAQGETGYRTLLAAGRVPQVPVALATDWLQTLATVRDLANDDSFETLVIDTLGGLELLCHAHVCDRDFKGDWGEKGFLSYHRGYDLAVKDWLQFLVALDELREKQDVTILMLSHAQVRPFKNPAGEDYDRYTADAHPKTWAVTHKWADAVLFAQFVSVVEKLKGESRAKGLGGTQRVVRCERRDAWDAKNRYGMLEAIDIPNDPKQNWPTIWKHIRKEPNAK